MDRRATAFAVLVLGANLWQTAGRAQTPAKEGGSPEKSSKEFSLALPTPDRLFLPETETQARGKIRSQAAEAKIKRVEFPLDAAPPWVEDPLFRNRPAQVILRPPSLVCFRTLYFEDPRTERYLESCGVLEPIRSSFLFYGRALTLPIRMIDVPPGTVHCQGH